MKQLNKHLFIQSNPIQSKSSNPIYLTQAAGSKGKNRSKNQYDRSKTTKKQKAKKGTHGGKGFTFQFYSGFYAYQLTKKIKIWQNK